MSEGTTAKASSGTTHLRKREHRDLTKGDAIKAALETIAIGIGLVALLGVGIWFATRAGQACFTLVAVIGVVVGIIFMIVGLVQLVIAIIRPNKAVKCPFCAHVHTVGDWVAWLYCQSCERLLLPGKSRRPSLVGVTCPHCGRSIGVGADLPSVVCDDCNLSMSLADGQARPASTERVACTKCGAALDQAVHFCAQCGELTPEGSKVDVLAIKADSRLRKSPKASLRLAETAVQNLVPALLNKVEPDKLQSALKCLQVVNVAAESLEEAVRDEANYAEAARILTRLDYGYALALQRLGAVLMATQRTRYEDKDLPAWDWVDVRQAVVQKLVTSDDIRGRSAFTDWRKHLIQWKSRKSEGLLGTSTTFSWIDNPQQVSGLFEEARLLSAEAVAKAEELGWKAPAAETKPAA
jgi:hypothetical protein